MISMLTYVGMNVLGMTREETLYEAPTSFLMMMLNQHVFMTVGDENMMTLSDLEKINANRTT